MVLQNPVLHQVLVLQEVQDLLFLLWCRYIRPDLENQDLQQDPGDPGLLLNLETQEHRNFPGLLSVLWLLSAPRLLSGPSVLEAPEGPGSPGAPEGPAAPEDLEHPSLLWLGNTDRWSSPDRRTAPSGRPRELLEEPSGSSGGTRARCSCRGRSRKSAASCPLLRGSPAHYTALSL